LGRITSTLLPGHDPEKAVRNNMRSAEFDVVFDRFRESRIAR
jgi:hypothetical protein